MFFPSPEWQVTTTTWSGQELPLPQTNKFKREKTYFLFGFIPIWHVSEQHDVWEYGQPVRLPDGTVGEQEEIDESEEA